MNKSDKIYVAGHTGLIGSAVVRQLQANGFHNLLLASHTDLELTDATKVNCFFDEYLPKYVILAAGKVGGITQNLTSPADFMVTNLAIQLNVLKAAHRTRIRKLILYASSCMYPRECPQPMSEKALLSHYPEPTSIAYAISKLAGMQMCLAFNQQYNEQRFIPVIPNSVFGPNDNFDSKSGHVLSSLINRFHEARQTGAQHLILWGSGAPRREFIHANDVADATILLLTRNTTKLELPLNLGTGEDISIQELAGLIARLTGYTGTIGWDTNKPDGASRKLLDNNRILAFGWRPLVDFEEGLKNTYKWYSDNIVNRKILHEY